MLQSPLTEESFTLLSFYAFVLLQAAYVELENLKFECSIPNVPSNFLNVSIFKYYKKDTFIWPSRGN